MIRPTEVEPREGVPDMASVLGRYGGGGDRPVSSGRAWRIQGLE